MMLTGKCKEDFEKWLINQYIESYKIEEWFYSQSENMKYGVYVDFFDSVGIQIVINWENGDGFEFWVPEYGWNTNHEDFIPTREKARELSIEKANDIYNNKNNNP